MRTGQGFTLIELLLALSLGSFVILGMMETYRGVIRYLERSRSMMETNRKVCLLFNQIERDISTAYIPDLYDVIPEAKKNDSQAQSQEASSNNESASQDKKKVAEEKEKRRKTFFMASIDEQADTVKIDGKRKKAFKSVNFICSHPFQVYGQKQVRLVRVEYQLVKDKAASKRGPVVYQLWRKETTQLLNTKFKEDEQHSKKKGASVKKYIVADNIKSMIVEFITFKTSKKREKMTPGKQKPPEEVAFLTWGDKKETSGVVPKKVHLWIEFWNDRKTSPISFHALFPVFSYPTEQKDKSQKDEAKERKQAGEGDSKKPIDGTREDTQTKGQVQNDASKGVRQ